MSSYFDEASLVMIPSGYKTSKLYSIKPTDGSGDMSFTRSNDTATRVGPDGLIEKVRTNVFPYSQDFLNAGWGKEATMTETFSQTDPNGGTTGVLVTGGTSGNAYYSHGITCTANVPNTFSIYIKGNASGSVSIRIDDSTTGPQYDINYTTSWQRFSVTRTPNQTGCNFVVGGFGTWTAGENLSFAFAQQETGDIATDYIATTSAAVSVGPVANVPRLDYLNSSCPRLLLEGQRANLATYSEQFDNAGWIKAGTTITANNAVSPDGYTNADLLLESAVTSSHATVSDLFSLVNGTTYTFSVFAKNISGGRGLLQVGGYQLTGTLQDTFANFNLTNGTVTQQTQGTGKIENYGNGWYRCSLTFACTNTISERLNVTLINSGTAGFQPSYAGDASKGLWIYGAMAEAASYATSYIPTLGASVTRGADACSKTGISSLIGQTEGTIFLDFVAQVSTAAQSHFWLGSVGNEIGIYGGGSFIFYSSGGVSIAGGSFVTGQRYKIAFAYKANDYVAYVNGVQKGTDTSATVPATSALYINSYSDFTEIQKKEVNQALLFKTRLSNSSLAELTSL